MQNVKDIKNEVRQRYGSIARERRSGTEADSGCCGATSRCCGATPEENVGRETRIGYSKEELAAVPDGANMGLGCGNPTAIASLEAGETVLDLGSGGGFDCFLAARQVGASGAVIGVDMTIEMVEKARDNAERGDWNNVDFRLGELEHLPVADNSVDCIISNCVINLVPDKSQVFRECHRVLRSGGRMMISDIVLNRALPEAVKEDVKAYTGCLAGASLKEDYLQMMKDAGFSEAEIVEERAWGSKSDDPDSQKLFDRLGDSVVSANVKAVK